MSIASLRSTLPTAWRCARHLATTSSSAPTVADVMVNVTMIDYLGAHHRMAGRVGMSLTEVCERNGTDLLYCDAGGGGAPMTHEFSERWTKEVYGEGPQSNLSHVVVANDWYVKLKPPHEEETFLLEALDDETLTPTSRLGTEIRLTKELDGLTVFVPDQPPHEIP